LAEDLDDLVGVGGAGFESQRAQQDVERAGLAELLQQLAPVVQGPDLHGGG